ncbi:uncharacterized protein BDW43DRAFT_284755 [Aspergillus alliaceus]|uniref:uncharacterized protein n=1 Tax=Petromyces alliaceus TaxID=209559 RepID=UPI0012A673CB|nr:uncharacterized protein BDW43DRAFT_284755 [Aspergillus alliaceus]KAB8230752.1 hypothetical protein BDW43DRAFT_284755 [Aspergillus alliaceus]
MRGIESILYQNLVACSFSPFFVNPYTVLSLHRPTTTLGPSFPLLQDLHRARANCGSPEQQARQKEPQRISRNHNGSSLHDSKHSSKNETNLLRNPEQKKTLNAKIRRLKKPSSCDSPPA